MKLCTLFLLLTISSLNTYGFDLTVNIVGIKDSVGQIIIGLYDSPESFLDEKKAIDGVFLDSKLGEVSYTFKELKKGRYAAAVIHDKNNNSVLDTGLFGRPIEGYGFTINSVILFAAPTFDSVAINIQDDYFVDIKLKY